MRFGLGACQVAAAAVGPAVGATKTPATTAAVATPESSNRERPVSKLEWTLRRICLSPRESRTEMCGRRCAQLTLLAIQLEHVVGAQSHREYLHPVDRSLEPTVGGAGLQGSAEL